MYIHISEAISTSNWEGTTVPNAGKKTLWPPSFVEALLTQRKDVLGRKATVTMVASGDLMKKNGSYIDDKQDDSGKTWTF